MTIETSDQIIAAVPIGEGNAATPRQIALTYGIGAESTWGGKLRQAVKDGKISRRQEMRPSGFAWSIGERRLEKQASTSQWTSS